MPNRNIPRSISNDLNCRPCCICGRAGDIEIDHIIPFSEGGPSVRWNLQALCRVCNMLKRSLGSNSAVAVWILNNLEEFRGRQWQRNNPVHGGRHWQVPFNFVDEGDVLNRP